MWNGLYKYWQGGKWWEFGFTFCVTVSLCLLQIFIRPCFTWRRDLNGQSLTSISLINTCLHQQTQCMIWTTSTRETHTVAKGILDSSANDYSVVQLISGAEMVNFRLGATVMSWIPWVVKVTCAAELAAEGLSQMMQAVRVSILPQVNDHLLQERLKRWYPEWQFTFRKFSPIKGFLFNESLLLHSEWFMAGFKMYCFDYAYTLWTP